MSYGFFNAKENHLVSLENDIDALFRDIWESNSSYRDIYDRTCAMIDRTYELINAFKFYKRVRLKEDKDWLTDLFLKEDFSLLKSEIKDLKKIKKRYASVANPDAQKAKRKTLLAF
ncbi:MAG: hypothetical protein LBV52_00580 [Spirochaetaceae bacterium]|jgi:hypothetical protein|nr:hypothetical protein [Spirochaetaceae bacterium]